MFVRLALAVLAVLAFANPSFADDWIVSKLRGLAYAHSDGEWIKLARGDVVADSRVIRTLPSGRVEFTRGEEVISLAGDSQIQIVDAARRKFTTVQQSYGTVSIEAERQNIQHFAVETEYLAAVVKGTKFTVTSRNGSSQVKVSEGSVHVKDLVHDLHVVVLPGQTAEVSPTDVLEVSGRGEMQPVHDEHGAVVDKEALAATESENEEAGILGFLSGLQSSSGSVGNDKGPSEAGAAGQGKGNSSNNSGNGNSDNSGSGNSGKGNNGNGNSGNGNNGGGNGNGNSGGGGNGNGNGNNGNGNSGGGGGGNGNAGGGGGGNGNSGNNGGGNGNAGGGGGGNGNSGGGGGGNGNSGGGGGGNGNSGGGGGGNGNSDGGGGNGNSGGGGGGKGGH